MAMNEAKQIAKERTKRVIRKDSKATRIAVWTLVLVEVSRLVYENYEEISAWLSTLS
jgi:hypothetical protein